MRWGPPATLPDFVPLPFNHVELGSSPLWSAAMGAAPCSVDELLDLGNGQLQRSTRSPRIHVLGPLGQLGLAVPPGLALLLRATNWVFTHYPAQLHKNFHQK